MNENLVKLEHSSIVFIFKTLKLTTRTRTTYVFIYRCTYLYTHTYIPTNIPTCKLPIYFYALLNCRIYNDIPGGRFVFTVTPGGFDFKDTPGGLEPSPSNRYLSVPFVGLLLNKTDGIPGGVEAGVFTFV